LIQNKAIFGDDRLHSFPMNGTTLGANTFNSSTDYICTGRPWYLTKFGWSDPYAYFNSPITARTYVQPVGMDGIVAYDYTSRECGQTVDDWACLGWTGAKRIALNISTEAVKVGFTDNAGCVTLAKLIESAMDADGSTHAPFAFLGYANDNFCALYECRAYATQNSSFCTGHDSNRVLVIRNNATFNDSYVHYFAWKAGVMGAQVYVSTSAYYPTERPWYVATSEWTVLYPFTTVSGVEGRSFNIKFTGGVLGVDTLTTEPCYGDKLGGFYISDRTGTVTTTTTSTNTSVSTTTSTNTTVSTTTSTNVTTSTSTSSTSSTSDSTTGGSNVLFFSFVSALLLLLIN